jgi:hypothetical protein
MAAALYVKDQENVIDFGNVIGFGLELEIYKQGQEQGFRDNIFVRLESSKMANPTMLPVKLEFDLITETNLIEAKSHTEQSAKQHNNQYAVLNFLKYIHSHISDLEMHESQSNDGSKILKIKQNSKLGIDYDICLKSNWLNQNNGQRISWIQLLDELAKTELQLLTRQELFSWVREKYPLEPTQEPTQPIPHSPERNLSYDVALQYALQVKNNELASWIATQHIRHLCNLNNDLLNAAWYGHAEVVNALLKALKDLNNDGLLEKVLLATNKEDETPLHCAAWQGHTEVVNALLNALNNAGL